MTVIERIGADEDGVPLARPVAWSGPEPAPLLRLAEAGGEAFPIGARAAARLVTLETGEIEARIIRRLDSGGERVVGVFRARSRRWPAWCRPTAATRPNTGSSNATPAAPTRASWSSPRSCRPRALARREPASSSGSGRRPIRARSACWRSPSFDIPTEFPAAAIAEAEAADTDRPRRARRSARSAAGHDRRQRRPRFRRRGVGRARPRPRQSGRLAPRRRDRRCRLVRPPRQRARPRGGACAATRSISPTASCRCCPRRCRTSCAR